MSVGEPFNIYRDQLSSLYHGLALWDPKPVENLHKQPVHVSIGDVGYLDNGALMRIFNVTLPWDDPSNKLLRKPEKYECIEPSYVRDNEMREGEYYTPNVSKVDNVGANRHEDSMGQMYQCSAQDRGALLSLPHKGLRKDVIPIKVFEGYIRDNVDSWFRWSKKMKLPVERMEDLILVTGCTLVTSWAAAAFDRRTSVSDSDATTISLEAGKSDGGGTRYFWRNIRGSVEYHNSRFDPNAQEPLPQNQCIFIRGFRAKRTFFRTILMRAAAEPLPDDPDDRREDEIKVTRIPDGSNSQYRDPLVGILDYIVQKCNEDISAAEDIIAITHDDDLQLIEDVESLTADAIENFLHENQLPLMVENGSAILRKPPNDKSPVSHGKKKQPAPMDHLPSIPFSSWPELSFSLTPTGPALPTQIRHPLPGTSSRTESQEDSFSGGQLPSQPTSIRVVDTLHPTLLVDGYISHSFGPPSAEQHFSHILKKNAISASYLPGAGTDGGSFVVNFLNQYSPVLDRCVLKGIGTVIPQVLWTPERVADHRQHVQDAELQLPIFFLHTDGSLGLSLEAAASGRCNTLLNSQHSAPVGPQSTTNIRICWRGYHEFRRQISTRDDTVHHSTVTLSKFAQHVGRSVDAFLKTAQVNWVNPAPQWLIGGRGIQPHEIIIIGATQVSSGSWMPILQLARHIL